MEESKIRKIKLILSIMALGMLSAIGAASGGDHPYDGPGTGYQSTGQASIYNYYYDWLSPGTLYWQYPYPTYYSYSYDNYWWSTHHPKYYYTTPVKHYYTWYPATYYWDPWYAANVYGFGSTTYYYSSSWYYPSGGFFFDP